MGVALLAGCMVVGGVGAWRSSRDRPAWRALAWAAAGLLSIPAALFVAYYAHIVDYVWYSEWRSWPATDYTASMCGYTAGVLAAGIQDLNARYDPDRYDLKRAGRAAVLAALATMFILVVAFARPLLQPLSLPPAAPRWSGDVCLQTTDATCGACAAATVLRHLGHEASEQDLAREADTDAGGTLNWLLVRALRRRGLGASVRAPATLDEVRAPAIIGVVLPNGVGHFLAYLGHTDGTHQVGEPLSGQLALSDDEFAERYRFAEFAMEISDASGATNAR